MANYNKVILAGNLTRDPQLSYLPSGTGVAEFGLAVNRRWRGQDGEMKEDTCFVDCRCYGRAGETIHQYLSKGQPILVDGRLQFQQWTAQDGSKRSKHIVVVEQFQFIGPRRNEEPSTKAATGPPAEAPEPSESDLKRYDADAAGPAAPAAPAAPAVPADSEIPF